MINAPDGPHRIDLHVLRVRMTEMLVDGSLDYRLMEDMATKSGLSRSTVSRFFGGHPIGMRAAVAVLRVLGISYADVVEERPLDRDTNPPP